MAPIAELFLHRTGEWDKHARYWKGAKRYWDPERGRFMGPAVVQDPKMPGAPLRYSKTVLEVFRQVGVIENLSIQNHGVHFRLKDPQLWNLLGDTGRLLELLVFYKLHGQPGLDDVRTNVLYHWSAETTQVEKEEGVKNELDVVVSAGSRLTCVSCKTSTLQVAYLNELDTVAKRIGGTYVRKVMVVRRYDRNHGIPKRAKEMEIALVSLQDLRKNPDALLEAVR